MELSLKKRKTIFYTIMGALTILLMSFWIADLVSRIDKVSNDTGIEIQGIDTEISNTKEKIEKAHLEIYE